MTRIAKKDRKKHSPRKPRLAGPKTGSKKDALPLGFKVKVNAAKDLGVFIPKMA